MTIWSLASYQYTKSCWVDKTILSSSNLHNGISYPGKILILNQDPDLHIVLTQLPEEDIAGGCGIPAVYSQQWSFVFNLHPHIQPHIKLSINRISTYEIWTYCTAPRQVRRSWDWLDLRLFWLIGPREIWMQLQISKFQANFCDWWLLWNCPQMNITGPYWWQVNICSGNGLVPPGNKPLPEPKLTMISVAI